jgi:hypothetical protein
LKGDVSREIPGLPVPRPLSREEALHFVPSCLKHADMPVKRHHFQATAREAWATFTNTLILAVLYR